MQNFKCVSCLGVDNKKVGLVVGVDSKVYEFKTCDLCGTGIVFPRPTNDDLEKFYSKYDGLVKTNILETTNTIDFFKVNRSPIEDSNERLRYMIALAPFLPDRVAYLDVGCGYGFSVYAGHSIGWDSHGIDYDYEAIELGRKNLNINLECDSIENFSRSCHFNSKDYFDVVSEWQVLEHVSDVELHLNAINQVLKTGGIYTGTVPNWGGVFARIKKLKWYMIVPPEHLNYFTESGLEKLLSRSGFEPLFIGTKFKAASPLIQFGVRSMLGKIIKRCENPIIKIALTSLYRIITLVKRYIFYFPLNLMIVCFKLGGNSTFFVAEKTSATFSQANNRNKP